MSADTFVALAAQILAERLAKEPQRVQELVAAAEQSAWAAAQAHLQDALLAAILDQVTRQAANVATASLPATGVSMPTPPVAQPEPAQPELAQREPVQPEPAPPKALPAPEPPTPAPLHESGVGIYVYGIIDDPSLVLPALAGMADGKLVRLYPYRSLAALVCEVPRRHHRWAHDPRWQRRGCGWRRHLQRWCADADPQQHTQQRGKVRRRDIQRSHQSDSGQRYLW